MDLGIAGRRALVCAASKGLGRGCAEALAREGVDVTICARTQADVERAAGEIGQLAGRTVTWVACDITTPEGRAKALAACPQPDILVNNAGGPPPGDFPVPAKPGRTLDPVGRSCFRPKRELSTTWNR